MARGRNPDRGRSDEGVTKPEISRREMLRRIGAGAAATAVSPGLGLTALAAGAAAEQGKVEGSSLLAERVPPGPATIQLKVNGELVKVTVEPRTTLLSALRDRLGLTGAKQACDRGSCGACTVLFDGRPVNACMMLALDARAAEIRTIEGLAKGGALDPVQKAFVECDALMCGYCTPGMVLSVRALLDANANPTLDDVKRATSGNLCRCGTYPHVFDAALSAAKERAR